MVRDEKILFAAWSCNNPSYFAHQTWDAPLRSIFKKIISFDPQEYIYRQGKEKMNKTFLELVAHEKPDYIFLWLIYDEFYPETLFSIKKISPKTKVINFCGDDDAQFYDYSALNSFFVDYSLISHKDFVDIYKNKAFFSVGTNTSHFKPLNLEKIYDVTFIGTPKTDRAEFISYLMDNGIKIKVFGAGWEKYPKFKEIYGGFLNKEDYTKVINQTKINLCFNKNYLGTTHVIQKFFEINACKAFMLTEYCKGYSDLYSIGKELEMFKDAKELHEKVSYYLKHEKERDKIAEKAYKKTTEMYSAELELRRIFQQIDKYKDKVPQKKIPKLNGKVISLSKKDILGKDLDKKLEGYSYVSFNLNSRDLPYRKLFQTTAMEMFNKEISCCDSYLHSKGLGDYLVLYSNLAFKVLKPEEFSKLITLDNLIVRKEFFMNNLNRFIDFSNGKPIDLLNSQNTAFITRPFIRLNNPPKLDYKLLKKVIWAKYEDQLKSYIYQRNPLLFLYGYSIIYDYLFGNKIILRHLVENISNRLKKIKLISSLQQIF